MSISVYSTCGEKYQFVGQVKYGKTVSGLLMVLKELKEKGYVFRGGLSW